MNDNGMNGCNRKHDKWYIICDIIVTILLALEVIIRTVATWKVIHNMIDICYIDIDITLGCWCDRHIGYHVRICSIL